MEWLILTIVCGGGFYVCVSAGGGGQGGRRGRKAGKGWAITSRNMIELSKMHDIKKNTGDKLHKIIFSFKL